MRLRIRACALLALGLALSSAPSHAQTSNNPLITLDENGNGQLAFPGGGNFVTTGVMAPDPGPGGLGSALTYNLLGPPGLVAGDLFLLEPGNPALISDVIRFNPSGTGGGSYPASAVFYSIPGGGSLADTGFPGAFYSTTASVTEVEGPAGTFYTPTSLQPGYIPGFGVTYRLISTASVPEPGALAALGSLGVAGLVVLRRRKK